MFEVLEALLDLLSVTLEGSQPQNLWVVRLFYLLLRILVRAQLICLQFIVLDLVIHSQLLDIALRVDHELLSGKNNFLVLVPVQLV